MKADRALVKLFGIQHPMHRFLRIDRAGVRGIHLNNVRRCELADAFFDFLRNHAVVLDLQPSDGYGHPTILVTVVVDGAELPDVPANRHQFI